MSRLALTVAPHPTKRQDRIDEIKGLLAEAGLTPRDLFLTQPPAPSRKDDGRLCRLAAARAAAPADRPSARSVRLVRPRPAAAGEDPDRD